MICSRVDSFSRGRKVRSGSWSRMCSAKLSKTQPIFTIAPVRWILSQKILVQFGGEKNGLADVESHLAAIDIKGGNHFDVLRLVRADATVHQAGTAAVAIGPAIKIDSLDERT